MQQVSPRRAEELIQQVRDLGHYPKESRGCSAEQQLAERIRRASKAEQFSPEQEAELQALRHASPKQEEEVMQQVSARRAEESVRRTEELIQQARDLGHYLKESAVRSLAGCLLAEKLRRALKAKQLSPEQEAELDALRLASQGAEDLVRRAEELMQQVRDIGHYPKESRRGSAEQQLAEQIRRARKAKQFSPEHEAELQALQQAERDARAEARIADAEEPPNPMEGFAEEAENRIDQDLLMLESGIRSKELLRRLAVYKELVSFAWAQQLSLIHI